MRLEAIVTEHKYNTADLGTSRQRSSSIGIADINFSLLPDSEITRSDSPNFLKNSEKFTENENEIKELEIKKEKITERERSAASAVLEDVDEKEECRGRGREKVENKNEKKNEKKSNENIIPSLSLPLRKASSLTEDSRGVAIAEILLHLPLSSLISSLSSDFVKTKKSEMTEEMRKNYFKKDLEKDKLDNDTDREREKEKERIRVKEIQNYHLDHSYNNSYNSLDNDIDNLSGTSNCERTFQRRDSLKSENSNDHIYRKKLKKINNLSLLTRAAQALSR